MDSVEKRKDKTLAQKVLSQMRRSTGIIITSQIIIVLILMGLQYINHLKIFNIRRQDEPADIYDYSLM